MKKQNLIVLIFTFILLHACAQQQTFDVYKTSFGKDFKDELHKNDVNKAVYAVVSSQDVIFQDAFSKSGTAIDENSPFLIGSITKVFTAVAVMQLCEQGKIDLDKPVSDYVPDFNIKQRFPDSGPITIRALLTHHAGIPSDSYLHKFSKNEHDFNELLPYLNSNSTCYPVGKIRVYSNLGYVLLGIMVERVSGLRYEDFIVQNIFEPLLMENSGFYSGFEKQKHLAAAYHAEVIKYEYPLLDKPAGAIYSTVHDMTNFCRAFIDKKEKLLKNTTLEKMYELQNPDNLLDMDLRAGLCFSYKNKAFELGRVLEHGGATLYHRAQMVIAPDAGLAAILLSDSPTGKDNAWKLDEQVMVEYCITKQIAPKKGLNTEKKMQFTPIVKKNLEQFAGNYAMPGMVCKFEWKNGYLSPTINGQNFYLVPNDSNSFVPAKRFMGMMFKSKKMFFLLEEIYGEKHFIQAMPWGGLSIIGTQTYPQSIPEVWKSRIGKYTIANADVEDVPLLENVEIAIENDFVVLKYEFNQEMSFGQNASLALNIVDDNAAYVLGYGRGGGESVVFDESGNTFSYMGLKFKKNRK